MSEKETEKSIIIYRPVEGQAGIDVRVESETVWLSQRQMAALFETSRTNIVEQLGHIYAEGELEKETTCRDFRQVRQEGKRQVNRLVTHYNLDAIISVGYRVNSITITQFRIWAAKLLRERLVQKCSVNQNRLESEVGLGEVLTYYLPSLRLLRDYDDGVITQQSEGRSPLWELGHEDAQAIIARLREEFPDDTLLGVENDDGLQSVVATIYQSFAGQDLYPTLEEKAANLLYLVVKDHPLADGNKRSAAALFVEFLDRNAALYQADGTARVSNNALAAMTLMVAMSSPQEKDLMVALIQRMINTA
ncbi:virulence protein RhuM/Fic/DOC family protein [Corynebacterium durum]|uniref:virulence protein RhuM/Fic/DOC family protein n=1 Tax=Corynebacterium durum TaxID=61592 RepID=UPI0015C74BFA|nr:virulence protein RhuM/Fic/DOC family protein [Corynebacterium durum]NYI73937.1 prophage maintenance system killer protein [Corynebacterium durum]WJY85661.1 Fic/DOC family protein [Corynebacterium durum]